MKKLLFLLLLVPALSFAQSPMSFYVLQDTAQIYNRAYAANQIDTCTEIDAAKWKEVWLSVSVTDTGSIHWKIMQTLDDTTYTPITTIDSTSVAAATGGIRTLNIKSFVGNSKFKLVFAQSPFRVPVAGTHKYTARMTLIP